MVYLQVSNNLPTFVMFSKEQSSLKISNVDTSRGSSPYTRTVYTIYRKDRHSGSKKTLSFCSSSTGKYGTTAAKAKQECIMEALLMYYKNSVYGNN